MEHHNSTSYQFNTTGLKSKLLHVKEISLAESQEALETEQIEENDDVYQRCYAVTSAKRITPAYIVKITVYPKPNKTLANKHLFPSINPQDILQSPITCHKCGKIDNDMLF